MRPGEFASALLEWIRADSQVRARSFADADYRETPHGVQVWLPTQAVVHLQVVGVYPAADPRPGHGDPAPPTQPVELPTEGPTPLVLVEQWLAWRITSASSPQIAEVGLFHTRPAAQRGVPHGAAVTCHNGDRLWVYFRHVTGAGRPVGYGPTWRVQPTV